MFYNKKYYPMNIFKYFLYNNIGCLVIKSGWNFNMKLKFNETPAENYVFCV